MNKKVFISMLVLVIIFLAVMYLLKIFFPQEFILSIQDQKLIAIGNFVDNHIWIKYVFGAITAFITYYLYCCSCKHSLYLKWHEVLFIVATIIICRVINFYDPTLANGISYTSFLFLPALMNGNLKTSAIVYSTHVIAQILSIRIRNLPMYLTNVNSITLFLFGLESYLWLLLLYVIFNYKKKEV